jgi:hypothetical protein
MNLHKLLLTNNACYKAGKTITPGASWYIHRSEQPNLKRYVVRTTVCWAKTSTTTTGTPTSRADGRSAFTLLLQAGGRDDCDLPTLPWNMRGWHCGSGSQGSGNDTHISFEICEDNLTDAAYFNAVYEEAVALCVISL